MGSIIDKAFEGPGSLFEFSQRATSIEATGALRQDQVGQFQFDQASNAEIKALIDSLNDPAFAAGIDEAGRS